MKNKKPEYMERINDKKDASKLKYDMMRLWRDTFHDDERYISMIFDSYFNEDLVAYRYEDGRLISALMGVPYRFGGKADDANDNAAGKYLSGLYLCGLSTVPDKRGMGVMTELIHEMNDRAEKAGFAFTFLIPASDGLAEYYADRCYISSSFMVEDNYVNVHDFRKEYLNNNKSDEYDFDSTSVKLIADISNETLFDLSKYILRHEVDECPISILHSENDMNNIFADVFNDKGFIAVAQNRENKIKCVAICRVDDDAIMTKALFADDDLFKYCLLDKIKDRYSDKNLKLLRYTDSSNDDLRIWQPYKADASVDSADSVFGGTQQIYSTNHHARPSGMIRILRVDEILEFMSDTTGDEKYRNLVKDIEGGDEEYRKGMTKLIFRRPDGVGADEDSLPLPRVGINFRLLLE